MSAYKEAWQEFYETALEAGLNEEDAGCDANARLADSYADAIDRARDQAKEDATHE